jgi:hypothetical protein
MHRSDSDAVKPSGFLPEGFFSCPEFLPEKLKLKLPEFNR